MHKLISRRPILGGFQVFNVTGQEDLDHLFGLILVD